MLTSIVTWEAGNTDRWTYQRQSRHIAQIIFELEKVPDFSSPRFARLLGERIEDRRQAIAGQQLKMLREFHNLGLGSACSLRLVKDGPRLRLFVVIREVKQQPPNDDNIKKMIERVQRMFPPQYTLLPVQANDTRLALQCALNPTWALLSAEILKLEETYTSNTRPFLYVVPLLEPQSLNDLDKVCRALLNFGGEGLVDITLTPTRFHQSEREWLSKWTNYMREEQTGERIETKDHQSSEKYAPRPELRSPVENNETMLNRYDKAQMFLYAFRVYASIDPRPLVDALASDATRSRYEVFLYHRGEPCYQSMVQATQVVDVAPEVHNLWWDVLDKPRPLAVQRLHRLADVDEVAGFFRLPIPMTDRFPGFPLDTGLEPIPPSPLPTLHRISVGTLADDTSKAALSANFDREALAKHGLIVGAPGSGKTTAVFSILHQLRDSDNPIPFIVLEPAKTEYRALKDVSVFQRDPHLLVFTLGDERISPFRFNPFEVPTNIPLESHIARLNACFTGAFNLFDPLPLLLDAAIRETYEVQGWLDDSIGGEPGLEPPTLADLAQQAEIVTQRSGYSDKLRDDINAALTQRLTSLMRGSKGRMLNVRNSIPLSVLMNHPVILELDSLNDDEKALLMMFILTTVYEHAKSTRKSGSPLTHVLVVEEAHNLIGRGGRQTSEYRANPREMAINLFVRMLAEMRALGQGLLIADQLPTTLAPEAVKNTNLKLLMRMTAKDDREEMGNTMDLKADQLAEVVHFKEGLAIAYVQDKADMWATAQRVRTESYKAAHKLEEPPEDIVVRQYMDAFEVENAELFMPFTECPLRCQRCDRRARSHSEHYARTLAHELKRQEIVRPVPSISRCEDSLVVASAFARDLPLQGHTVSPVQAFCAFVHLWHQQKVFPQCSKLHCECVEKLRPDILAKLMEQP